MRENPEIEILKDLGSFTHNPLGFVMYAYLWGEGELKKYPGPEDWQKKQLIEIGESLKNGDKTVDQVIQEAIASGHGIGKSCQVSWIIMWGLLTHEDTKIVVTANTETQLKTKTWSELAKWHQLCWFSEMFFEYTATAYYSKEKSHEKTWRADMISWSIHNTEAFAGLHNKGKRLIVIFDEASSIPDKIWEVTEGALTDSDTEIIWLVYGNPTLNTGRFKECFGRLKHRWRQRQIDSRSVSLTNKKKIQQWIDDYGEDSDFVRVRVTGIFPRSGLNQFISSEDVWNCMNTYKAEGYESFPLLFGIDIARFGDDQNVIVKRQGRKVFPIETKDKWRGLDTMVSSGKVNEQLEDYSPTLSFIDGVGVGGGVVDRVKQLADPALIRETNVGLPSPSPKYFNKRAEIWGKMRDAIKAGIELPNDPELERALTGVQYGFDAKNQIQLERKKDMKARGEASPDEADSLAMTWWENVIKEPEEEIHYEMHDTGGYN